MNNNSVRATTSWLCLPPVVHRLLLETSCYDTRMFGQIVC